MSRFKLSNQAEQDLEDIWTYIAQDSETIEATLAKHPALGYRSPTGTPNYQLPLTPLAKIPRILFTSVR